MSQQEMGDGASSNAHRLFLAGIGAIAAAYLLQMVTPLRLDTDTVRYLTLAIGLAEPTRLVGASTPLGYPAIVAALDRMGLGSTQWIVALNCIFLGLGVASVWWMARDRDIAVRRLTIVLTLLSYIVIHAIAMPQPEAVYFGLSLTAIAAMSGVSRDRSRRNVLLLAAAFFLTAAAITIRLAGLALVPALIWSILNVTQAYDKNGLKRFGRSTTIFLAVALVVAAAVAVSQHGTLSRYVAETTENLVLSPMTHALRRMEVTLRGLGVLMLNMPLMRIGVLNPLLAIVGILPAAIFLLGFRRMAWQRPVLIYVVTYVVILMIWPFYAPRLWMPIVPLLVLHAVTAIQSIPKGTAARILLRCYLVWFMTAGTAALAYTTWISLAGENFRSRYGRAGGMSNPNHENPTHDAYARMIIERFDADNPAWRSLLAPTPPPVTETQP